MKSFNSCEQLRKLLRPLRKPPKNPSQILWNANILVSKLIFWVQNLKSIEKFADAKFCDEITKLEQL
jgi:hypothetical protein